LGGNARSCLDLVASGRATLFVTDEIWNEYSDRIPRRLAEEGRGVDVQPVLAWLLTVAQFVEGAPLGKPRSRDLKDDRYLACALQIRADAIVSNDRDFQSDRGSKASRRPSPTKVRASSVSASAAPGKTISHQ
jgi:predicted nucleic acid-binding protein